MLLKAIITYLNIHLQINITTLIFKSRNMLYISFYLKETADEVLDSKHTIKVAG